MERGGRQESYTYRDLRELAERAGAFLVGQGVKPADRVILFAKNSPEWPMCYFGILKAGATAVPVAHDSTAAEVVNIARASGAVGIMLGEDLQANRPQPGARRGAGRTAGQAVALPRGVRAHRRGDGARAEASAGAAGSRPTTLASLIFTSGTTGNPKGVMLTHRNSHLHGGRAVAHLRPGHLRLHDVGAAAAPHASSSPPACSCRWRTARASPTCPI